MNSKEYKWTVVVDCIEYLDRVRCVGLYNTFEEAHTEMIELLKEYKKEMEEAYELSECFDREFETTISKDRIVIKNRKTKGIYFTSQVVCIEE